MITKSFLIHDDTDIYEIIHDGSIIIRILHFDSVLQNQSKTSFAECPENVQEQIIDWMNREDDDV